MYKVLVINANEVGYLEQRLNEMSNNGFEVIHFFESNNRLVGVLRLTLPTMQVNTPPMPEDAPYGYKKDGTPKKAPGRKILIGE